MSLESEHRLPQRRLHTGRAVGGLLLSWSLTACGAGVAPPGATAPSSAPGAAGPVSRVLVGEFPDDITEQDVRTWAPLPAEQVDAPAPATDAVQEVLVAPDGLALSWTVMTGMCSETSGTALESEDRVEVALDIRSTLEDPEDPEDACAAGGVVMPVTVLLVEPLGVRAVRVRW